KGVQAMQLRFRHPVALILTAALFGCPKSVQQPTANATAPAEVNIGTTVQLDGTASSDPQGRQLSFDWCMVSLPSGSKAALNDAHSTNPTFVADVAGKYVVQLVVGNSFVVSEPLQQTITVDNCGSNAPVIASITETPEGAA